MLNFKIISLLGIISLTACTTSNIPQVVCPKLEKYSEDVQKNAARELKESNSIPTIKLFVKDYGVLRERLRSVGCKET